MSADGVREPDKRTPEMKIQFSASGQPPNQADRPHRAVVTGQVQMHATLARPADPSRHREQQSMNILLMGDFTGRACAGDEVDHVSIAERPLIRIDIDNLEKVMANCSPRAIVRAEAFSGEELVLEFRALEDFHPDELYEKLDIFKALRDTRQRLMNPSTFGEAAAELQAWAASETVPDEATADDIGEAAGESEDAGSTFERLLAPHTSTPPTNAPPTGAPHTTASATSGVGGIGDLIRRIVQPHIVPAVDPQRDQLVSSVDDATSGLMRAILHDPCFQRIEAAWRSVFDLAQNVETGEDLKLFLLDVTKQELAADIAAAGANISSCDLYRKLVDETVGMPGAEPWSVLACDYTFGPGDDDIALLSGLGTIASHAGAPLLAAADAALLGCDSFGTTSDPRDWSGLDVEIVELWNWLRESPQAMWLGLVLPRLLLRLPYGKSTEPLDSFDFEEIVTPADHESYLWGNGAFACARLIAESFVQSGWSMQLGDCLQIDDVPAHIYVEDGESKMKPPAEAYLSERAMEAVLSAGIMPLVSFVNRNVVRLARFQSLAHPPHSLAGPWEG